MKKINLLTPIFGLTAIGTIALPVASCSCSKEVAIPTDSLNVEGTTLKGLKDGVDISKCTTLVIPSNVETIAENAFSNVFTAVNKVSKVVITSNVKTIKAAAFELCYGVSVFDFSQCSSEQINNITIENNTFGDIKDKYVWYANIQFNSKWANDSAVVDGFKTKLSNAGVPGYWYIQPTTGHIEYDNVTEQKCTLGAGYVRMYLLEPHEEGRIYVPVVSKVDGTAGVGIECDNQTRMISNKTMCFNSTMTFPDGYTPKEGDWVSYKVTLFCIQNQTIKWVQNVQIYKSIYKSAPSIPLKSIYFESPTMTMKVNETKELIIGFQPSNATEKGYTLYTSEPLIASIEDGKVTALKPGRVTLTVIAVDGGKTGTCELTVTA